LPESINVGYIRVSTKDQNPARQIEKLRSLVSDERYLYVEQASGKNFDRPIYQQMKNTLRAGDLLYIDCLDRLGRNYQGIIDEWKEITQLKGADIVSLDNEFFDSRKFRQMGDLGKLLEDQFLSLLAYVAETERKKIRQRQREGIDLAKQRGVYQGKSPYPVPDDFWEHYIEWLHHEISQTALAQKYGRSRSTIARWIKVCENKSLKKALNTKRDG